MSRVALYGFLNLSALLVAIFHAHQLNGTFYASSDYFAESRLSMIILGSFGLYCMFLTWKLIKSFFLGPLRLIEREVSGNSQFILLFLLIHYYFVTVTLARRRVFLDRLVRNFPRNDNF